MIEINLNSYCWVKLTAKGKSELERQHNEFNAAHNGVLKDYMPPQEDSEGWSKWQIHSLMNELGHLCENGSELPFETTIRLDVS
jgi:hypothetical protein